MHQCGSVSPIIKELQHAVYEEGTGSTISLSYLRKLVAVSGSRLDMCSGTQQDSVEFIDLLLHSLPSEFINPFTFNVNVLRKFEVNGQLVACPSCDCLPNVYIDTQNVLQLPLPATSNTIHLSELLNQYFSPIINNSGMRCPSSMCSSHSTTIPPRPFSAENKIIQFPNYLFIQLNRFERILSGQIIKIKTQIMASESISLNGIQFKLIGILNHHGSYEHGHYNSVIKNVDHWILCNDDDNPKIIPLENLFTNANYMFLFEKVVVSVSQSGEGNFNLNTVSNKPESITNILLKDVQLLLL